MEEKGIEKKGGGEGYRGELQYVLQYNKGIHCTLIRQCGYSCRLKEAV